MSKNTVPLQPSAEYLQTDNHETITNDSQAEMLVLQNHEDFLLDASRLLQLGVQQQQAGKLPDAIQSFQESLALFQAIGDRHRTGPDAFLSGNDSLYFGRLQECHLPLTAVFIFDKRSA